MDNFGRKVIEFMVLVFFVFFFSGMVFLIVVVKSEAANATVTSTSLHNSKVHPYDVF